MNFGPNAGSGARVSCTSLNPPMLFEHPSFRCCLATSFPQTFGKTKYTHFLSKHVVTCDFKTKKVKTSKLLCRKLASVYFGLNGFVHLSKTSGVITKIKASKVIATYFEPMTPSNTGPVARQHISLGTIVFSDISAAV